MSPRDKEMEQLLSRSGTTVGKRVRYFRLVRGFKVQKDFARECGMSQGALSDLENGRSEGSDFLPVIAEKLRVQLSWLRTGKGEPEVAAPEPVNAAQVPPADGWPFSSVSQSRIGRLNKYELHYLESTLISTLNEIEDERRRRG